MPRRPPLVFIYTVTLTGILANTLVTPALPAILDEFDAPPSGAGWLVATGSMAGVLVAPIIGILADRLGRRIVLVTCLTVFGVFGASAALAPSFEVLLISRVLQGVGAAGLINLAVVLIGDNWSGPERTRLIGRNTAVLTVGLAGLPLISGVVTQLTSWRVTFGIFTVALLTAVAAWTILDAQRPTIAPRVRDQVTGAALVLRQPILIATLGAGFVVFMIIFGLFLTVVPVHLADEFGLEAGALGAVIALPAVTSTLAAFNLGRITALFSARHLVIASAIGLALTFATMGLAGTLLLIVVAALIYGASEGVVIPLLQDLAVEFTPAEHRASVIAVWVAFVRLGQTVGPLLAGVLIATLGTGATLVTGATAAGLILLLGLAGPFPRAHAPELR